MRHRIESPFSFRLAEKKTAIHGQKKRRLGMSWPLKRPTHPKRGADRYGLPTGLANPLAAALYPCFERVRSRNQGAAAIRAANRTLSVSFFAGTERWTIKKTEAVDKVINFPRR